MADDPNINHDPFANEAPDQARESWGSKLGLILAMAGNAIGLGNFLRFPCKAASNGGGAFMIPYFIAFILLGIPIMWAEWAMGRLGGKHGHGNIPAVFDKLWKNPVSKYIGVLGVTLPLLIVIYYNYIESWTLSYAYFSVSGKYDQIKSRDGMAALLDGYTGKTQKNFSFAGPLNADANAAATKEVSVPFGKFYGDGAYKFNYDFVTAGGKKLSAASEFSVVTVPENLKKAAAVIALPPEVASITPAPGEIMAAAPKEIKFIFNEPVKQSDYNISVTWDNIYYDGLKIAMFFFIITFILNIYVMYRGVESGIETLAKIGMPILFVFAIILAIKVMMLETRAGSVLEGLGFMWNPDFNALTSGRIWLEAAGQIFFTLSICTGAIQTYASFLKDSDDIALTGLTTAATNEFAEVILGGSIAIPASVVFFGAAETVNIAKEGAFNLGFCSMPIVFTQIPFGHILGAMWFGLLFFAGITSSVALAYPAIVFLKDELKFTHGKAVAAVGTVMFVAAIPVMIYFDRGFLDEMDFWAGTFGLAVFGFIELVYFCWIFGMDNAWEEMHHGHSMKIPRIFYYVMKYVTPLYILVLILAWGYQDGYGILMMNGQPAQNIAPLWGARIMMASIVTAFIILIKFAWDKKRQVSA